jgi:hypothetical protein
MTDFDPVIYSKKIHSKQSFTKDFDLSITVVYENSFALTQPERAAIS